MSNTIDLAEQSPMSIGSEAASMTDRSTLPTPARRPGMRRGVDSCDNLEPLFAGLAQLDHADEQRKLLRETLICRCLPLAENIARKYACRGENFEDLLQSARVGLVLAVDRFDPDQGVPFPAFAIPTIMGEVRRYFRDCTWAVQVPRRLKEIQQAIGPAIDRLFQRLGHTPTAAEIAAELDSDLIEVTHALIARNGYRSSSIDASFGNGGDYPPLSMLDTLGGEQPEFGLVEDRVAVRPLIEALPEQDRRVLLMRFFDFQPQARIADSLGVSQMQVSRRLTGLLNDLREQALRD
ncbi:SigB/SigF/SigG family RNA polymerase sigma factor [Nocardia tengchongensis]|uniref:SigB/SigF/SigG family RNA polymerase sigma factor n=1 Tax=Nocardia tengchongensis TaxID=2055889 RepID=UPI00340A8A19